MNEDGQGGVAEIDEDVKALWIGKWFWPILEDLEKLRKAMEHLFPEVNDAIKDDAPVWVFRTVWACGLDMADYTGIDLPQNINARKVGMMVGTQCSICETYARAYQVFSVLKPEQIRKIDAVWGIGFSHECTEFYREFAEKWTPLVRDLKRKAMNLALERFKQNYSRFIWIEVWLEDAQPENRFLRFKGENLKDLRQRGRQP